MRVSKTELLEALPVYQDSWETVLYRQRVPDIIKTILQSHRDYREYYDCIAGFFDCPTVGEICDKLFDFCKANIVYREESEEFQSTSIPTGILVRGFGDCKHYAGFIAGVLSALERQGRKIDWKYCFASYKLFERDPYHVFVTVRAPGENEIWVDPTPGAYGRIPVWICEEKP